MNDIYNLICDSKKILLLSHESPDGDAIGSLMAFYHMLKDLNKKVDVLLQKENKHFSFLSGIDKVVKKSNLTYDLAVVLDCASKERIGQDNNEFDRCKKSIVIDHHTSNTKYGNVNYIEDSTPSCCQVIYYLFKQLNITITKEIGEALCVGMITDTAGFRNDNVNSSTFLMAADLINMGVDMHRIFYLALCKRSMPQYMLMKMVLDRMEILENGKIAFSYISHEDMENVGAMEGDHEGLVDLGRNIDGVEVSIFMREEDGYRISFRSNGKVDVTKVAEIFGGGGHKMAAGAKSNMNFKETKDTIINVTIKELNK